MTDLLTIRHYQALAMIFRAGGWLSTAALYEELAHQSATGSFYHLRGGFGTEPLDLYPRAVPFDVAMAAIGHVYCGQSGEA
jgi:hypothetical protein